jgi:glycosyltransferase involved in cell wall biosynthesis
MSKILAVGTGPLLEKGVKKIGGQCLRTWHFVKPLLDDGHQVSLVTLPIPDREKPPEMFRESSEKRKIGNFSYISILKENPDFLYPFLSKKIQKENPDCIIGINTHPSGVAARVAGKKPLWSDLNGWAMAEAQICAHLNKDDSLLSHFWKDERDAVRRSDRFSTVTKNQKLALMGELAALGRFNQFTYDYPFADVIENAVNPIFIRDLPDYDKPGLKGGKVPKNAFIVLWSGGFNTWTDVNLLYKALEGAMKKNERIYFVSTGGRIDGHDEKTYTEFHRILAASPFRKRFILLGWIDAEALLPLYSECDIGINVDAVNYETLFGARNRITNMLATGLPVVTTRGTEISRTIAMENLGNVVPMDDPEGFSAAILELASNRAKTKLISDKARKFARERYSYEFTTALLREWVREPSLSTDNLQKIKKNRKSENLLDLWLSSLEKNYALLKDRDVEELLAAERDLHAIRSKGIFKLYKKAQTIFKRS